MGKIVLIIVAILVIILGINFFTHKQKSYYPDSQGWNRKPLQGDTFEKFFPLTLIKDLYLITPNEEGLYQATGPTTLTSAFIEYRDNTRIDLGETKQPFSILVLTARRSFYAHPNIKDGWVFKIWAEQVSSETFLKYKELLIQDIITHNSEVDTEKSAYKDHEYYIYLRKDLTTKGLEGKNSIGGANIFFPENNISLFLYFFNTKYKNPDVYMITKNQITAVIQEIVDSTLR